MSDLISRADAIEAVHEYYQKRFTEDSKWDADAKMLVLEDKTIAKDNIEICNIIKALPSADAVQGWIPIKDGLPKPYKDVMATVWFEDYSDDDDAFEIAFGFLNKFGKWNLRLADGCECIKGFYVQAWQPLPKPYREDGEV